MELSEWRDSTRANRRQYLNSTWLPALGDIRIKDITVKDVRLADKRHAWGGKGTQRRGVRAILAGVFQLAVENDYIEFNPAYRLKKHIVQAPKIDPFTPQEKEKILAELSKQAYVFYIIAFDAGFRLNGRFLRLDVLDVWEGVYGKSQAIIKEVEFFGEALTTSLALGEERLCAWPTVYDDALSRCAYLEL
jgi:hypothetical protein